MVQAVGGIFNIDVNDKQLQVSCAGARQKYTLSVEDEKKKKAQQAGLKSKAVSEETDGLKKLQLSVENDIDAAVKLTLMLPCLNLLLNLLKRLRNCMTLHS